MVMLMDKPVKSKPFQKQTSKIVTKMTVSHFLLSCTWEKHAWQDRKGFRQSRKQQSSQAGRNMSHGNTSRWRRAVAMAMRPETHAGIPQQCLGWMKRRGAAPGCHEKGGEEKTIKYKSQQSQAETHTHCRPLLAQRTAGATQAKAAGNRRHLKRAETTQIQRLHSCICFWSGICARHFQCKFMCFSEYQPELFYFVDNHFWSLYKPTSAT